VSSDAATEILTQDAPPSDESGEKRKTVPLSEEEKSEEEKENKKPKAQ